MEGVLWKWTNYIAGWQQRWFVLNAGVLSYYLSQSEVGQGCKGSLKVASCDILVHPNDPLRLDIIIPGERHLYLRAPTNSERQEWLMALGSMKQEDMSSFVSEKKRTDALASKMVELHLNCQLLTSQLAIVKSSVSQPQLQEDSSKLQEISLQVSTTCDRFLNLLAECMDLTSDVRWPLDLKPLVSKRHGKNSPSLDHSPLAGVGRKFVLPALSSDVKAPPSINGSREDGTSPVLSSLLPTQSQLAPLPHHLSQSSTPRKEGSSPSHVSHPSHTSCKEDTTSSSTSAFHGNNSEVQKANSIVEVAAKEKEPRRQVIEATSLDGCIGSSAGAIEDVAQIPDHLVESVAQPPSRSGLTRHAGSQSDVFHTPGSSPVSSPHPSRPSTPQAQVPQTIGSILGFRPRVSTVQTFFSRVPHKFEDLVLTDEREIPTSPFLDCCREVIPFFDTLNSTAFAPVKADINGNIEKLNKKYNSNPELFSTLQSMVLYELETNTHGEKNSSTDALLWLKRAMEFIQVFVDEVAKGEQSLDTAAGTAYGKTLRQFHNWIVRGIFSLAVKAVPYYQDFINLLGGDGSPQANEVVLRDMTTFAAALGYLVKQIGTFYVKHKLEHPL